MSNVGLNADIICQIVLRWNFDGYIAFTFSLNFNKNLIVFIQIGYFADEETAQIQWIRT